MTTTKITAHTYVCELPDMIQNQILAECKATFESLIQDVKLMKEITLAINKGDTWKYKLARWLVR